MMLVPIIYAGAITCFNCGHFWHDVLAYPPYTGRETCQGGGYVCIVGSHRDYKLHPGEEDMTDPCYLVPACDCPEFVPVDVEAFEVTNA